MKDKDCYITKKLFDVVVELDARVCSGNSVVSKYSGTSWEELCNKGIELFKELKK